MASVVIVNKTGLPLPIGQYAALAAVFGEERLTGGAIGLGETAFGGSGVIYLRQWLNARCKISKITQGGRKTPTQLVVAEVLDVAAMTHLAVLRTEKRDGGAAMAQPAEIRWAAGAAPATAG